MVVRSRCAGASTTNRVSWGGTERYVAVRAGAGTDGDRGRAPSARGTLLVGSARLWVVRGACSPPPAGVNGRERRRCCLRCGVRAWLRAAQQMAAGAA